MSAKWSGWDFTLYDKHGEIACFNSDLSPSLAFRGIESVDIRHGGMANLNNLIGAGALGRVLYLISQRTWEPLSHSGEHYYLIEQLLKEEGIEVGTRPLPGPPSPEPSTNKRPGPRKLPGINFSRVKAHVESTRYKEPKTEPKPEPKLEWGDYTALIEAIERADPKRKRKKPTPPPKPEKVREPKPKKVREPKPKRRIPWDSVLMLAELLLAGVTCYIVSTQGLDSPWPFLSGFVCIFVALFGLAESTKPDDQDE